MTDDKRIVLCSHCAAKLRVPADGTQKRFKCAKCGEHTTIQLGLALANNATAKDPDDSVVSSMAMELGGSKKRVVIASVIALIVLVTIAIGVFWKKDHDTQLRNEASAASSSKAAAAKAAADAQAADQARRDADAKRAKRALAVMDIEVSIKTMAQKHVADGLFDGPVLSVSCSPVGGGSTDDLTAKTTVFDCFVATKNNGDGTSTGRKYHATMNWDTENYTYGYGPAR
ncbi:zinc ribbon domain-containing protein [Mycobacterium paragordonae]|uniref:Zinc finger/thioredoxin putative domain-containing protein n=1 Tax=Mycobacterium paragordonae TaxID=1389713 RepID=A0ABQ1C779_9MYCO|nr:zinc ribbon domain-containing protein [Mycobacterium paragordonae]GFG80335.1 hypothetical protein MPRG_36110 [Mycobacterium paragordonae]